MNVRSFFLWIKLGILPAIIFSCTGTSVPVSSDIPPETESDSLLAAIVEDTVILVEEEILPYRPSNTRVMDLIHTKLEVSFDWEKQQMNGVATLELTPYYYPQSTVKLDAKGFEIQSVRSLGENESDLEYTYDGEDLLIDLKQEYRRSESVFVKITYIAKPNELEVTYGEAIEEDRGLYFINPDSTENKPMQIWTQGEPEANQCWFPTIDAPNERCTQEMYITVKDRFTTLSNGSLIYSKSNNDGTRTDYWKMDQPHAPYLFMMAIGEFAVVKDTWNDKEVSYYVEPEFEASARGIFGNTPEMISFFSEKLKYPYPWDKYSQVVVRDYVSGAMENTTASVFMEDLQMDNRELIDYNWDDIIAHELFHQWFGDLVTTESWANLTLNEAFATYSEYLWYEYKYGKDEADIHLMEDLSSYLIEFRDKQTEIIRFYHEDPNDMFDSHTYQKGGAILHMLRNYVGDAAFFDALNLYLKTHAFQSVEIHDLRQAFETITGEDLNWFFNQWFLSPGHPVLQVDQEYDSGLLKIRVEQIQDTDKFPVFELPLLVDIYMGGESRRYSLLVTDDLHEFQFQLDSEPELVIWDAEQQLLGEIRHPKSYKELMVQYDRSPRVRPRFEAIASLADSIHLEEHFNWVLKAMNDSSWHIRSLAINTFDEYEGPGSEKLKESLIKVIKSDPKSITRADAIAVLSSIDPDGHVDLIRQNLQDSSYTVLGASLYALSQSQDTLVAKDLERFESVNNEYVVIPIAAVYAEEGGENKFEWFASKMDKLSDSGLYYMVNLFGQYLMVSDTLQKQKGSEILASIAKQHSSSVVKLSAFQSLGLIDELESVKALKQDIVEQEQDEDLKQLFQQFQ